jgi:hypothetical protein
LLLSLEAVSNVAVRIEICSGTIRWGRLSYGPPWAHCLGWYQDRLVGRPLGLLSLCHTAPNGVGRKDYGGEVLG